MRQTFLLYLATADRERARRSEARCCSDEPVGVEVVAPGRLGRWSRKLARAVPASASAFRGAFGTPLRLVEIAPGDAVVTTAGEPVGEVRDVVVGRRSGRASVAVEPTTGDAAVVLFPAEAVHRRERGVVVLRDEAARLVA